MSDQPDPLTNQVIGYAIKVHKALGAGLLESAYEECLAYEFEKAGLPFHKQASLPVVYGGVRLDCGYRVDFIIDSS